jgi:hypothetical protein
MPDLGYLAAHGVTGALDVGVVGATGVAAASASGTAIVGAPINQYQGIGANLHTEHYHEPAIACPPKKPPAVVTCAPYPVADAGTTLPLLLAIGVVAACRLAWRRRRTRAPPSACGLAAAAAQGVADADLRLAAALRAGDV